MCHDTILTAMREAAAPDMAFAVHGGDYNSGTKGSLDLAFAIFMLSRNGASPGTQTKHTTLVVLYELVS